jgi:hypothetical protein
MITVHQKLSLTKTHRGRRRIEPRPEEQPVKPTSSVPRISRLMALAIKYQGMLDRGEVSGITELARLCRVTQPRMTQILNLNLLTTPTGGSRLSTLDSVFRWAIAVAFRCSVPTPKRIACSASI